MGSASSLPLIRLRVMAVPSEARMCVGRLVLKLLLVVACCIFVFFSGGFSCVVCGSVLFMLVY